MREGCGMAPFDRWEHRDPDMLRDFPESHSGAARLSFSRAHVLTDSLVPMTGFFVKNVFCYRTVPLKSVACRQPNWLNPSAPRGTLIQILGCSCILAPSAPYGSLGLRGCAYKVEHGCPDWCTLYMRGRRKTGLSLCMRGHMSATFTSVLAQNFIAIGSFYLCFEPSCSPVEFLTLLLVIFHRG